MIGSMIRSDRAIIKNNGLFRKRNARKVKKREETRARDVRRFTKLRRRRHTLSRNRYRKVFAIQIYIILASSPRERTDREELKKRETDRERERERERERTYSPLQKQKKKRSA